MSIRNGRRMHSGFLRRCHASPRFFGATQTLHSEFRLCLIARTIAETCTPGSRSLFQMVLGQTQLYYLQLTMKARLASLLIVIPLPYRLRKRICTRPQCGFSPSMRLYITCIHSCVPSLLQMHMIMLLVATSLRSLLAMEIRSVWNVETGS